MENLEVNLVYFEKHKKRCLLCPNRCGVNRFHEKGICNIGNEIIIASYGKHFGEESVISGNKGSGTVFFSGCNLKCIFCQNYEISQASNGTVYDIDELADLFIKLEDSGVHNINLVSPTHVIHLIAESLYAALKRGLSIPVIYNCGGYELTSTIKALDGLVDIYMPDIKYGDDSLALKLSAATDYTFYAKHSLKEMFAQVGGLQIENGIAKKGVLVRHLILPGYAENSIKALELIRSIYDGEMYINVMDQFYPAYESHKDKNLVRKINSLEYDYVVNYAKGLKMKIIS